MGQVRPLTCPIRGAGGEVCPGAKVETAEGAEKFEVIQTAEPQGQRPEKWVRHWAPR